MDPSNGLGTKMLRVLGFGSVHVVNVGSQVLPRINVTG